MTTRQEATALLRESLGDPNAIFRDGQLEAIEGLVERNERMLVVQRTGWGKSMVYFVATALLRRKGRGPTLIVSPLISLMRNQLEAAGRIGLSAASINCENKDLHEDVLAGLLEGSIDLLLIAPERFANPDFRETVLAQLRGNIGLLVVDEAHCISDWGHDFRPDYRRIAKVLRAMPGGLPVLGTTATANSRVVNDVKAQLGERVAVVRGSLRRDSLRLQNIELPNYAARLAWLCTHLPQMDGAGIVYVLTKRDAERISQCLRQSGIDAHAYHSDVEDRASLEQKLIDNEIRVLVATVALGMGFDKPDLGFVIHFQRPMSAIHYYQQVGRAGRGIPTALGVLFSGTEDDEIAQFFIDSGLPPASLTRGCVQEIREAGDEGLTVAQLASRLNARDTKVRQALALLETEEPSAVVKEDRRWFTTPAAVNWTYDSERELALREMRSTELRQMQEYVSTRECLQVFLARELDSDELDPCGRCYNCAGDDIVPRDFDPALAQQVADYMRRLDVPIDPRKLWPGDALDASYGFRGTIRTNRRLEQGRALCVWGDAGWGDLVRRGKHSGWFADELVDASAELVTGRWGREVPIEWLAYIPSLENRRLVPEFAHRLAERLGIECVGCVEKVRATKPQKEMVNSWNQARNLAGAFSVRDTEVRPGACLLVDDMVDSRWTLTIVGALLREAGADAVYPFALANSAQSGG